MLGRGFVFIKALLYLPVHVCYLFALCQREGMVAVVSQAVLALESNWDLCLSSSSGLMVFSDTGLTNPSQWVTQLRLKAASELCTRYLCCTYQARYVMYSCYSLMLLSEASSWRKGEIAQDTGTFIARRNYFEIYFW